MAEIALSPGVHHLLVKGRPRPSVRPAQQRASATESRVSAALDPPMDVLQLSGLSSKARDLFLRLDSFGQASKVIGAAERGIKALTRLIEPAEALARQALETTATTPRVPENTATVLTGEVEFPAAASMDSARRDLAARFDQLRGQIDPLVEGSCHNGINLLDGGALLLRFGDSNAGTITVAGVRFDAEGLGVNAPANHWQSDTDILDSLSALTRTLARLRNQSLVFRSALSAIRARGEFARDMAEPIETGADLLLLPDQNEEAIRLVALTARQQLASTALGLAKQAEGSVLRLF